jgi:hypothetical protein
MLILSGMYPFLSINYYLVFFRAPGRFAEVIRGTIRYENRGDIHWQYYPFAVFKTVEPDLWI